MIQEPGIRALNLATSPDNACALAARWWRERRTRPFQHCRAGVS